MSPRKATPVNGMKKNDLSTYESGFNKKTQQIPNDKDCSSKGILVTGVQTFREEISHSLSIPAH